MKRIITIILAALMIVPSALVSCSEETEKAQISDSTEVSEVSSDTAVSEKTIYDILPEKDFEGKMFTLYNPVNEELNVDKGFMAEEITGEIFNDAVYNRNLKITEKYNFQIEEYRGAAWNTTYDDLRMNIYSGEKPYNMVLTHIHANIPTMVTEGLLRNWSDLPYIDFTQPWWNHSIIENLNIANKIYYTAGSLTIQCPLVLLFNKEIVEKYNMENPYDLVRSGKWTIDKMAEMAKTATLDVDGNSKWNPTKDEFGLEYPANWRVSSITYSVGDVSVIMDSNGYPTLNLMNDHAVNVYEKIYSLFYDDNKTVTNAIVGIESGRILFEQKAMFDCENIKDVEIDYGIVPMPKYDESEENYRTNTWTGMYALPVTLDGDELDFSAFVIELMSALAYDEIVPVYYEQVMKHRISPDPDSAEMIDIILNNIVYDFGLSFELTGVVKPGSFMQGLISNKRKEYASEYAKIEKQVIKEFDKIYNAVIDINT